MKGHLAIALCTLLAFVSAAPSAMAAEMILESDSPAALKTCDNLHHISSCDVYHFTEIKKEGTGVEVAYLNEQPYIVKWMGPAYYLESGAILHPVTEAGPGLLGQQWLEAYPNQGRIHTTKSWIDTDANNSLNRSDTLIMDSGSKLRVRDVRLNLRVVPLVNR